jgi:hypothetical protein
VDFSKFKTSDWLVVGGGAGMLIFGLFLDWAKVGGASGNNAFDYFFTGGIAWLLIVGAAVVTFLLVAGVMKAGSLPWPLIILGATGLGALLMLLRLILGGGEEGAGGFTVDLDRAAGMYLSFIAAIVAAVGGVMRFKESGGDLSDLKDINKIKESFSTGGDSPSGGMAPPPPPPPAAPPPPPPPVG